ncbi:MAG: hypothetical protein EOO75_03270 [Myxococcales bacterium]|nr:MAG: hypothetical protein EOO75_03270 [Myxococcales bacterium]
MTQSAHFHAPMARVLATMMLVALGVACGDDGAGGGGAGSAGSAGASGSGNAGNDTGGGDGPGPALTLTQYCEKVTRIEQDWCAYSEKCCSDDDRSDYVAYASYCPVTGASTVSECVDSYQKLLDSKAAVFDGTWAEQCITESLVGLPRAPSTCQGLGLPDPTKGHGDPEARQIASCRKTFRGQVAKGQKCTSTYGCAGDLTCANGTGTASGELLCRDAGTFGSPCLSGDECLTGYFCVPSGGGSSVCDKPGAQGGSCRYSNECQEGLLCAGLKCVKPREEGDACGSGDVCGPGMACFYASSTSTKAYCEPRRADGTSCTLSSECAGRCDSKTKKCTSLCGS